MFKSVEYAGLDGYQELRRLAESGTELLPDEIRSFREDVCVRWVCHPDAPAGLELILELELRDITGRASRRIPATEFGNEGTLRSRIRWAWLDATGDFLEKRKPMWDELHREPVEA